MKLIEMIKDIFGFNKYFIYNNKDGVFLFRSGSEKSTTKDIKKATAFTLSDAYKYNKDYPRDYNNRNEEFWSVYKVAAKIVIEKSLGEEELSKLESRVKIWKKDGGNSAMGRIRTVSDDHEEIWNEKLEQYEYIVPKTMKMSAYDCEKDEESGVVLEVGKDYPIYTIECELGPTDKEVEGGYNAVLIKDDQVYLVQNVDFE